MIPLRMRENDTYSSCDQQQKKKPLGLFAIGVFGVSPASSRTPISVLVPGDSGGKTAFSDVNIRGGMAGFRGEMVER